MFSGDEWNIIRPCHIFLHHELTLKYHFNLMHFGEWLQKSHWKSQLLQCLWCDGETLKINKRLNRHSLHNWFYTWLRELDHQRYCTLNNGFVLSPLSDIKIILFCLFVYLYLYKVFNGPKKLISGSGKVFILHSLVWEPTQEPLEQLVFPKENSYNLINTFHKTISV